MTRTAPRRRSRPSTTSGTTLTAGVHSSTWMRMFPMTTRTVTKSVILRRRTPTPAASARPRILPVYATWLTTALLRTRESRSSASRLVPARTRSVSRRRPRQSVWPRRRRRLVSRRSSARRRPKRPLRPSVRRTRRPRKPPRMLLRRTSVFSRALSRMSTTLPSLASLLPLRSTLS